MSEPLRVLILEDRPADAELMVEELRKSGFDPDWQRLEQKETYVNTLERAADQGQLPDVILSDYVMPQFDALKALQILQEMDLPIPFIVVTGSVSEEVAVECMKEGAADYLLKDRLTRLGPAVKQALKASRLRAERQRAEAERESSLHELQIINDTVTTASRLQDVDAICDLIGETIYAFNERAYVVVSLYDRTIEAIRIRSVLGFGERRDRILEILGVDPRTISFSSQEMGDLTALYTSGKIERVPGGTYDLLNRKIPQGVCQALERFLGLGPIYTMGFALENHPYGGVVILVPRGERLQNHPVIETLVTHFSTILHRRQAEQALRASEARYRNVVERANEGIIMVQREAVTYANARFGEMVGLPVDQVIGMPLTDLLHPAEREKVIGRYRRRITGEDVPPVYETILRSPDGQDLSVELNASVITHQGEKIDVILLRDISDRKKAERALRDYADRLRALRAIDGIILAAYSQDEILASSLQHVRKLIPYTRASVLLLDEEAQEAHVVAEDWIEAGTLRADMSVSVPYEMLGSLEELRRGRVNIVPDIKEIPDPPGVVRQLLSGWHIRNLLVVPLLAQGRLIGVLTLGAKEPSTFQPQHLDIAQELGGQVAVGIQQAHMRQQIERHAEELEDLVAERTRDLERRTMQLHVAAEVARDATAPHKLTELLDRAAELIRERFGFYHAGVFLLDETKTYAVLQAASGEAGEKLLTQHHRLAVGQEGIVGYVIQTGEPRIAHDVGEDAVHFDNPLLPETRSEVALPFTTNDDVIGALDVQSVEEAAFDEDDVAILQIVADQLAVAIERTRLFERTQAALEERLRTVVANAPIILVATDAEGRITLLEGRGLELFDVDPAAFVGQSVIAVAEALPDLEESVRRALNGEVVEPVISFGNVTFELWLSPQRDEQDQVTGIIGVATDVTERKRAEEEVRRLARFPAQNPSPVLRIDREGTLIYANRASQSLLQKWHTQVGHALPAEWQERILGALEAGSREYVEVEVESRTYSLVLAPIPDAGYINVYGLDITERKRIEQQLRQQERLAAVGELAGGIAHDFNNFLTSIMLYAQLMRGNPRLPDAFNKSVDIILGESRKAAQLVQQILDFSRRSMIETQVIDIVKFVDETCNLLRRTLPENIHLLIEARCEDCQVNVDPTRIQQMITNLALNARDAMPYGGELCITLNALKLGPDDAPPVADMSPGQWVHLGVSDTGTGIPDDVLPHIFEPFFTTKGPGEGTGLGLAQVYGIVKQHDGFIDVETEEGEGATFHVYFPTYQPDEEEPEASEEPTIPPMGKGETILLVEDEKNVREASRRLLTSLHYHVLTAANGEAALELYRATPGIDLVLVDIVMPAMGGEELIGELRALDPTLKVVAMTGYALQKIAENLRASDVSAVLYKPLEMQTLAETVRETLDAD